MDKDIQGKVSFKISNEITNIAKRVLILMESFYYGRLHEVPLEQREVLEKEFVFLRSQILDIVNDSKRVVQGVLNKVKIVDEHNFIIKVREGKERE